MNNATELRLDSGPHSFNAAAPRGSGRSRRTSTVIWPLLLVVGLILALGVSPAAAWRLPSAATSEPVTPVALGPGTVFPTVAEAAFDALRFATLEQDLRHRGRIRAGTIFQVGEGFSYREPTHSHGTVWSIATPVVRFEYAEGDVASYVVHPRSGRASLDRANEGLKDTLRRRIERSGSSTRPLFLLTPKLRVIRYAPGEKAEVLSGFENRTVAALLP